MIGKIGRYSPWYTVAGVILLLIGLGWDALLHRLDPALASHESIFSLNNSAHLLFATGIALIVINVALFLFNQAMESRKISFYKGMLLFVAAIWLIGLGGLNIILAFNDPGVVATNLTATHTTIANEHPADHVEP